MANNPPRRIDIRGQDHMLAYITPEEGGILQLLGGSGAPGPMGIPSFFMDFGMDDGQSSSDSQVMLAVVMTINQVLVVAQDIVPLQYLTQWLLRHL